MREQQLKMQVEIQNRINGYEDKDNLPPFSKRKIAAALLMMGVGLTGFVHAISDTSFGEAIFTSDSHSSEEQLVNVAPTGFDKVKANTFEEAYQVQNVENTEVEQIESEQVLAVGEYESDDVKIENTELTNIQTPDSTSSLEEESIVNAQTVVIETAAMPQEDVAPLSEQNEPSQVIEDELADSSALYKNALANNSNTDVYDAYNTDNSPQPIAAKSSSRAKQEAMLAANNEIDNEFDDESIDSNSDDEQGLAVEHSETDLATDGSGPVSGSVNEFNESVSSDTIKRLILTRGIVDKEPREESAKHIDSQVNTFNLFLFTELNGYTGGEITHRWIWSDKVVAEINLKVGESKYRTWSSKRILWRWQGNWRVEVLDNNGNVMKVKYFSYGL